MSPPSTKLLSMLAATWPAERWRDVTVLLAVSGGADSVALARGMSEVRRGGEGRLVLGHFNHRLRGAESDADQAFLAAAHRLAAELFSGQTRGPGKPFIEHLVATASILISCRAPVPIVAAGLLHAAYDQGDFGVGLLGRHSSRKAEMLRVVGADVEDYVHRYHTLRWTPDDIRSLETTAGTLPARTQRIVFIRLANELEEHLDCAIQFCANAEARLARMNSLGPSLVNVAAVLGQPDLASALGHVFVANRSIIRHISGNGCLDQHPVFAVGSKSESINTVQVSGTRSCIR